VTKNKAARAAVRIGKRDQAESAGRDRLERLADAFVNRLSLFATERLQTLLAAIGHSRAERDQAAVAVLENEFARAPWRVGQRSRELDPALRILGV